jgi:hypothetical protein
MIKVTNVENLHQRNRVFAVTNPEQVSLEPLELVCGRNLEKKWAKGRLSSAMGNYGGSSM